VPQNFNGEQMSLNDGHEFMNFDDFNHKRKWWIGRLVQAKYNIKYSLFDKVILKNSMGLVKNIFKHEDGADCIIVHWPNGLDIWVRYHDIWSQN
tara:strand:+ start:38 stop:319 length:282 start_codon:yes stop_codon:yes gene_type:complete